MKAMLLATLAASRKVDLAHAGGSFGRTANLHIDGARCGKRHWQEAAVTGSAET